MPVPAITSFDEYKEKVWTFFQRRRRLTVRPDQLGKTCCDRLLGYMVWTLQRCDDRCVFFFCSITE